MKLDGKLIGHVRMKFNGVLVAESTQRTTKAEIDAQTDRFLTLLEAAVKQNS